MFIHLLGISIGDIIIGGNVVVGGDETEVDEIVGLIVGLVMGTAIVGTWGFSEAIFIPLYAYALLSKCAIGSPPVSISLFEISEIKLSIGLNVTNTYDNNEKVFIAKCDRFKFNPLSNITKLDHTCTSHFHHSGFAKRVGSHGLYVQIPGNRVRCKQRQKVQGCENRVVTQVLPFTNMV